MKLLYFLWSYNKQLKNVCVKMGKNTPLVHAVTSTINSTRGCMHLGGQISNDVCVLMDKIKSIMSKTAAGLSRDVLIVISVR